MSALQVSNISARYGDTEVLSDVSFKLHKGAIGCLLGPSGSGKSTLLRTIAGFEKPTEGFVKIGDKVVCNKQAFTTPDKRGVGIVFQDLALFPHLSVRDNIAFGLQGFSRQEMKQKVNSWLERTGLSSLDRRYPAQLSGGEMQRVALARALVMEPRVLLLDEPFSKLDAQLKRDLSQKVHAILKEFAITTLLVTHDQEEAFGFADEIGVLHDGKMEQWGSAHNLYHNPATEFCAGFIGQGAFIQGKVINPTTILTELGNVVVSKVDDEEGAAVQVYLRDDQVAFCPEGSCMGRICQRHFRGGAMHYLVMLNSGQSVLVRDSVGQDRDIGCEVSLCINEEKPVFFCPISL